VSYYGDTEGETIEVPSNSRPGVTHYVSVVNGAAVSCTCESFTYRSACPHADGIPTEHVTKAYGRPQLVGRPLSPQERYPLYQQYLAQRPRPGLSAPTFVGDELKSSPSLYLRSLGVAVDGAATVGRLLAEAGRAMKEAYFGKTAEKAAEWRDAPTGEIKHLPPGGSAE
jgi:hypothetical protein